MAEILFVGDPHITGRHPISRKESDEEYRNLILDKIDKILQICKNKSINYVIFLGDMFNNNTGISNSYEVEVWSKLLEFKTNNINLYTIIGNHDMVYQNQGEFKGSYLYKAFLTGIIQHLDSIVVDNVLIQGIDYMSDFRPNESNSIHKYNICVAHCFYENSHFGGNGNGNLTNPICESLGYQAYVLGHDHMPYALVEESNFKIIRPGSLTRGTSKTCNLYRQVQIASFNTSTMDWSYISLDVKSGTEVFNDKVILTKQEDLNMEKILENFNVNKGIGFYDIIDEHEIIGRENLKDSYDEVVNLITFYSEVEGIFRKME